jgi:hypothetical protein
MDMTSAYYRRARITRAEADKTGDAELYELAASDFSKVGCHHAARACTKRAEALYILDQSVWVRDVIMQGQPG